MIAALHQAACDIVPPASVPQFPKLLLVGTTIYLEEIAGQGLGVSGLLMLLGYHTRRWLARVKQQASFQARPNERFERSAAVGSTARIER
jgi:hypothetical protein